MALTDGVLEGDVRVEAACAVHHPTQYRPVLGIILGARAQVRLLQELAQLGADLPFNTGERSLLLGHGRCSHGWHNAVAWPPLLGLAHALRRVQRSGGAAVRKLAHKRSVA